MKKLIASMVVSFMLSTSMAYGMCYTWDCQKYKNDELLYGKDQADANRIQDAQREMMRKMEQQRDDERHDRFMRKLLTK